jgi:hypothetical protein
MVDQAKRIMVPWRRRQLWDRRPFFLAVALHCITDGVSAPSPLD